MLVRRGDKGGEQRMRLQRLGFELGMELAAQIPGMVRHFADLDVDAVGRLRRSMPQAAGRQDLLVFAVEFVAVAVALADLARRRRLARAKLPSASRQGYAPRRMVPPSSSTPFSSRSL